MKQLQSLVDSYKSMPRGIKIFTVIECARLLYALTHYNQTITHIKSHLFYGAFLTFGIFLSPFLYTVLMIFFLILNIVYLLIFFKKYIWGWYIIISSGMYMVFSSFVYMMNRMLTPSQQLMQKAEAYITITHYDRIHPYIFKSVILFFSFVIVNYYLFVLFYFIGKRRYFSR